VGLDNLGEKFAADCAHRQLVTGKILGSLVFQKFAKIFKREAEVGGIFSLSPCLKCDSFGLFVPLFSVGHFADPSEGHF